MIQTIVGIAYILVMTYVISWTVVTLALIMTGQLGDYNRMVRNGDRK